MGSQNPFTSTMLFLLIGFSATLAVVVREPISDITQILDQPITPNISQIFEGWMKKHRRVYSSNEEKARRFELFKKYYLDLQKRNKEEGKSYRLHRFADRSEDDVHKGCVRGGPRRRLTVIPKYYDYSNSLIQRSDFQGQQVDWSKDRWIENGQEINKSISPKPVRDVDPRLFGVNASSVHHIKKAAGAHPRFRTLISNIDWSNLP